MWGFRHTQLTHLRRMCCQLLYHRHQQDQWGSEVKYGKFQERYCWWWSLIVNGCNSFSRDMRIDRRSWKMTVGLWMTTRWHWLGSTAKTMTSSSRLPELWKQRKTQQKMQNGVSWQLRLRWKRTIILKLRRSYKCCRETTASVSGIGGRRTAGMGSFYRDWGSTRMLSTCTIEH